MVFRLLKGEETIRRRRNNTDQDQNNEQCVNGINKCVNGTSEEKLNFIYEELCLIREGQDRIRRGMSNFQQGFCYMNEKLWEVIEVTNTQSCVLRTLAYKSIDLEARSRRNNLIFWGSWRTLVRIAFKLYVISFNTIWI